MSEFNALIEKWAMRLAVGNNGGEWDSHYTEKQKSFWREKAREFLADARSEANAREGEGVD